MVVCVVDSYAASSSATASSSELPLVVFEHAPNARFSVATTDDA
jgi:hypothetical protein